MNDAHVHLLLNHTPILGTLFGTLVLGYGWLSKSRGALKVGLATLLLVALVTIPAYITGEGAAELVEKLPGINLDALQAHENVGEWALWSNGLVGTAALLGLLSIAQGSSRDRKVRAWILVTLLLGSIAFTLMVWTGLTGGAIRHAELREVAQLEITLPGAGGADKIL